MICRSYHISYYNFAKASYPWLQHCRPSTSLAWHSGLNLKVGLWTKTPKRTNLFCGTFPVAKIQQTESNAWTRAFIELRYLLHPGVQSSCFHGVLFSPEGPQDGWKNWQERNLALNLSKVQNAITPKVCEIGLKSNGRFMRCGPKNIIRQWFA